MDRENSSTTPLKTEAKALRKYLAEQGIELGHSKCLEAVAKMRGFKNWDTASAKLAGDSRRGHRLPLVVAESYGLGDLLYSAHDRFVCGVLEMALGRKDEEVFDLALRHYEEIETEHEEDLRGASEKVRDLLWDIERTRDEDDLDRLREFVCNEIGDRLQILTRLGDAEEKEYGERTSHEVKISGEGASATVRW